MAAQGSGSGSGSGSGFVSGVKGTSTSPPPSSLAGLFERQRSAYGREGGLIQSLANFNSNPRPLCTPQAHEAMGSQSANYHGTGAHSVPRTSHVLNGQGQNGDFYGKNMNDYHTCLGSSLYYGGQDLLCVPSTTKTGGLVGQMKMDDTKDGKDSGAASRGDWWLGSLYY